MSDASLAPEGVGTKAQILTSSKRLVEDIAIEYVDVVPDQRIVFVADPKVTVAVLGRHRVPVSRHRWTWEFTPAGDRTRLAVTVVELDAP